MVLAFVCLEDTMDQQYKIPAIQYDDTTGSYWFRRSSDESVISGQNYAEVVLAYLEPDLRTYVAGRYRHMSTVVDDAVQAGLIRVWAWLEAQPNPETFNRSFLMQRAVQGAIDELRKEWRQTPHEAGIVDEAPDEYAFAIEDRGFGIAELMVDLSELPADERALALDLIYGKSRKEQIERVGSRRRVAGQLARLRARYAWVMPTPTVAA